MPLLQILRPTLPILIGASLMLTLSMGLRQSLGITTSECETQTLAECDAAFDLLEHGLSDVTDGPAG